MNDILHDMKVEQDLKRIEIAEIRQQAQCPPLLKMQTQYTQKVTWPAGVAPIELI